MKHHLIWPCTSALALAAALAACGGTDAEPGPYAPPALFDNRGQPSAAARQRPATAPPTRSGFFATPEQVRWETLMAEPYTVLVDIDTAASPADALAEALRNHTLATERRGVAHFVRGGAADQAAAVADALTAAGVERVFLVTERAAPGAQP